MGQKVNPNCFRVTINSTWQSSWYSDDISYKIKLHQDIKIRKLIFNKFKFVNISKICIDRFINKVVVNIFSSKPGVIIGKRGGDIAKIKNCISKIATGTIIINITEVKDPEICPSLIASFLAEQLEKRVSFKKIMKRAISNAIKTGVEGIKISMGGRLGGIEIARTEWYKKGRIPLHTLRFKIEYALAEAKTIYGIVGIKVWIYSI